MKSIKLPDGFRVSKDSFADLQRVEEELFASEGLDLLSGFPIEDRPEESDEVEESDQDDGEG
ncbi:MAG: hypothetical protein M3335_00105 [Actinomycetota bacterium]|nr:hypothetical protein [Actinomycetota bacterium]